MSRRDDEWDEAKLAIQETGAWVRHTDTKAALLVAASGAVVAAVLTQADEIAKMYTSGVAASAIGSFLIGATLLSLTMTVRHLFAVIRPRVDSANALNRFAWPNLARMTDAARSDHYKSSIVEGWAQARQLAALAADKYDAFGSASSWFAAFLVASIAVVIAAFVA